MSDVQQLTPWKLAFTGVYLLFWPALIFLLAGDWRWLEAWLFGAWFVSLCTTSIVWLYRRDPALLAERYRAPGTGGQQRWDTYVVYGIALAFMSWIAIMPLDARRYHWTPRLPLSAEVLGGVLLLGAAFFLFRALTDNTFLSPLVRHQAERDQRVVSTGVYAFVRHPMYLGASLLFVGGALLLGSFAGLGIGLATIALLTFRIIGEERMLMRELPGYRAYRERVRYRLVPGVW